MTLLDKAKGFLRSVVTNGRDLFGSILFFILVLFVTQFVTYASDKLFGIDFHDVKDIVWAISKFAFVPLLGIGYLCHVTFRQSLGHTDIHEFMDTWKSLTPEKRLTWFFVMSIVGMICASILLAFGV